MDADVVPDGIVPVHFVALLLPYRRHALGMTVGTLPGLFAPYCGRAPRKRPHLPHRAVEDHREIAAVCAKVL